MKPATWEDRFNELYPPITVDFDGSEADFKKREAVKDLFMGLVTAAEDYKGRPGTALASVQTWLRKKPRDRQVKITQSDRAFVMEEI